MEYFNKKEVMEYLDGYRKECVLRGEKGDTITHIIDHLESMYTFRPETEAQWFKKGKNKDFICCSRCGFQTLVYKNSKYCPNCGRLMTNGKSYDEK